MMKNIIKSIYNNKITKIFILLFCCGIILGIVIAHKYGEKNYNSLLNYGDTAVEKIKNVDIDKSKFFYYILLHKTKDYIIFWLITFTFLGIPNQIYQILKAGFNTGFIITVMWKQYSFKGILILISSLLPHGIIYSPLFVIVLYKGFLINKSMYLDNQTYYKRQKQLFKENILWIIAVYIILVIGAYIESHLGYFLIKGVL